MNDKTVTPLQDVVSDGEKFALELATMFVNGKKREASTKLKEFADKNKLVMWEWQAIANIATCMIHNKKWKK